MIIALICDKVFNFQFSTIIYVLAYIPVGFPVMKEAWEMVLQKDFFNEYSLMFTATIGAFIIGEYPEGVAVMLFYAVGELFEDSAVDKARGNIKALLDLRPQTATVMRNGAWTEVDPENIKPGETILVKAGGKIPLDGILLSPGCNFNTSALTGESRPKAIQTGEPVLAGMLSIGSAIEIKATKAFKDSSLARILEMVQDASTRKAPTELLIRKFARIYTPVVFALALLIVLVPYFIVPDYVFKVWLYRALIFLVISCPCALVISVPLGFFGGIGAASRAGILFKGANFLDIMTKVDTVVMDKTGTLTKGVFQVQEVVVAPLFTLETFLPTVSAIESRSTHPAAKAIVAACPSPTLPIVDRVEELAGLGIKGNVDGHEVLVGSRKLMQKYNIAYDTAIDSVVETVVIAAINGQYAGYMTIADEIKEDAAEAIKEMHEQGITQTVMLSGDSEAITQKVAKNIGIDKAFGNLMPEDKVKHVEKLKAASRTVAFVGDGINDAPVLALSDVGIAMGAMGSDAAIEVADVVIQTDQPTKIVTAIRIAKATKQIVAQNIILALSVKLLIMGLGVAGIATMWGAVFADVGVALLAILNAVRILEMKF
ncbi:cadmium/zinc/cobalt-transporting ATPase [Bacteroidia bacterium]|nr:cadmium/zinc/cobalt-transporting ATPase [Bacteroidia bacterium]